MKQAVIYARVSSKDQEREGYSIPAQLKLLREYARTHDFEIAHEFVDEMRPRSRAASNSARWCASSARIPPPAWPWSKRRTGCIATFEIA